MSGDIDHKCCKALSPPCHCYLSHHHLSFIFSHQTIASQDTLSPPPHSPHLEISDPLVHNLPQVATTGVHRHHHRSSGLFSLNFQADQVIVDIDQPPCQAFNLPSSYGIAQVSTPPTTTQFIVALCSLLCAIEPVLCHHHQPSAFSSYGKLAIFHDFVFTSY